MTPIFLSLGSFSRQFSALSEKNEENLSIRSLNILENAPSNSLLFSPSFIYATTSNASSRVKFCENVVNIWHYLCNRPTSTKYD